MLTDRQQKLLNFMVREYVRNGEPIGSALVFEKAGFDVSPATIRNEMMDLEAQGFLKQPHTSAGRVPTDKAYRLFVNALLENEHLNIESRSKRTIDAALAQAVPEPREINHVIAQVLNELTDTLVIVNDSSNEDFYQKGLSSLLEFPEFREFSRMFQLMSFFDQFDELFQQLDREFFSNMEINRCRIFIGRENPLQQIMDDTMIHAKYRLPNRRVGSVTIIGPMRMDYENTLGLVNYTAEMVNKLTDSMENNERKE